MPTSDYKMVVEEKVIENSASNRSKASKVISTERSREDMMLKEPVWNTRTSMQNKHFSSIQGHPFLSMPPQTQRKAQTKERVLGNGYQSALQGSIFTFTSTSKQKQNKN